jgi:hypothetical protein
MTQMDYQNVDAITANAHLHPEKMPRGLTDKEKRKWLKEMSLKLKDLSKIMLEQYNASGLQIHLTFSDAFLAESEECRKASVRKYIERSPTW